MFLDIAVGAVLGWVAGAVWDTTHVGTFIVGGIVLALLPDVDFLMMLARRGRHDTRYDHEHRDLLHRPVPYIALGSVAAWLVAGPVWAGLFAAASLWHFLHDSTGVGWGVAWGAPWSRAQIGLCHAGLREICGSRWVQVVPRAVLDAYVARRPHDGDWMRLIYLRPTPIAIVEYGALVLVAGALAYRFL